jgi:hypothetical protein
MVAARYLRKVKLRKKDSFSINSLEPEAETVAYKREWSDRTVALYDYVAAANWRGWPVAALILGRRRLTRLIKQNETLWRLFTRMRSALGAMTGRSCGRAPPQLTDTESPSTVPE